MRAVHDRHAPSAFPFSRALSDPAAVTSFLPERTARRTADLHLRGPAGPLPVQVLWPAPGAAAPPAAVLYPGAGPTGEALSRALCAAGLLVVCARTASTLDEAASVLEWVADHGEELHADAASLLVAGAGSGSTLAAELAEHARERGWPPLAGQVLLR
jgi:acetyl esterase